MNVVERAKELLTDPKQTWKKISTEKAGLPTLTKIYVMPWLLAGAFAAFIGYGFIGMDTGILGIRLKGIDWGFYIGLKLLISTMASIILTTYAVDWFSGKFTGEKNMAASASLVVYAITPLLLANLLRVFPAFAWSGWILGLYSIYLFYLGLNELPIIAAGKRIACTAFFSCVMIICLLLTNLIVGKILGAIFGFGTQGEFGRFGI